MNTQTYPKASLQKINCPRCQENNVEHGGYRNRKLRTVRGIEERKVMKLRCRNCKKHLKNIYPKDTPRASWYSTKIHGLMAILSVHHVTEGCCLDVAELFEYPLVFKTRQAWQDSRVRRIEQQERAYESLIREPEVGSIDECKIGSSWGYTLTDTASDFVCSYAVTDRRNFSTIRSLVAQVEPKAIISDGCKSIQAAMSWFNYIPHGRCWFHVMQDVCSNVSKEDRPDLVADLQVLYENDTLAAAHRWYTHLMDTYEQAVLQPLINSWHQLKWWWKLEDMPLTNNTSEHLYAKLWPRQRKRDKRSDDRKKAWLAEAIWRHNHKPVFDKTPFESLFELPSLFNRLDWLKIIIPQPHTNL